MLQQEIGMQQSEKKTFLIETFGYKSQNAEITANMGATDWENSIRLVNGETHLQTNEFLVCDQFNPFYLAENSNI